MYPALGKVPKEAESWATSDSPGADVDRLLIVCTMSYEQIFRRPNLARTAAQLAQAGRVLWIIIEDTHSLRKRATSTDHYTRLIKGTRAFVSTLGVNAVYIADDSPFPTAAPRSPKIETYQRNLGLKYAYSVVENATVAASHGVRSCSLSGDAGKALRKTMRDGKVEVSESEASLLFQCPVGWSLSARLPHSPDATLQECMGNLCRRTPHARACVGCVGFV